MKQDEIELRATTAVHLRELADLIERGHFDTFAIDVTREYEPFDTRAPDSRAITTPVRATFTCLRRNG